MRHLNQQEVESISGSYYFYDIVQGAEMGAVLGFLVASFSATSFPSALSTGIILGATFGLLDGLAFDIDMAMWSAFYQQQQSTPLAQPFNFAN